MKKLETLLNKTKIEIIKNDVFRYGRYTIVELTDNKGHDVFGISRKSDEDKENAELGVSIARGRAERTLYNALNNRKVQHPFMG